MPGAMRGLTGRGNACTLGGESFIGPSLRLGLRHGDCLSDVLRALTGRGRDSDLDVLMLLLYSCGDLLPGVLYALKGRGRCPTDGWL
jgi:hypothetical protein